MPASTAYPEVVICMPNVLLDGEELQPCISGSQALLVQTSMQGSVGVVLRLMLRDDRQTLCRNILRVFYF